MLKKRDYIIIGLINGGALGVLAYVFKARIPVVPFWVFGLLGLVVAPSIFYFIRKFSLLVQFAKFGHVGALNTGIDFAVLNILVKLTAIYSGPVLAILNAIAFLTAVLNSYFWNKYWTFEEKKKKDAAGQFVKFFVVTLIGIVLNSFVVFFLTSYIKPVAGVGQGGWVNIAKAIATVVSLIWNFVGYRVIVFKT